MEWISIEDKLPQIKEKNKAHVEVLGWDGKKILLLNFRYIIKMEWNYETDYAHMAPTKKTHMFHTFCPDCLGGYVIKNITHWMPLPKTPTDNKKDTLFNRKDK